MRRKWRNEKIDLGTASTLAARLLRESIPPNLRLLALAWICVLFLAMTTAGLALVTRYLVNNVFVDQNAGSVWLVTGAIIGLSVAKGVAAYFQSILNARINRKLVGGFQTRQFERLTAMELRFFGTRHASEFVTEMLFAARGAAAAVMTLSSNVVRDGLTLVFLGAVMVAQDPLMSLCAVLILPVIIYGLARVSKRIRKIADRQVGLNADVTAVATETVEGIKIIKSFALEAKANRSFRRAVRKLEDSSLKINRIASLTSPLMETLGGIAVGIFVLYASWQSLAHGKSPGEFMAFITAFLFAYEPAKRLANVNVDLQKQFVAVNRLYRLLDAPDRDTPGNPDDAAQPRILSGDIVFEDVSFSYEAGKSALDTVSLHIAHGEKVAIVGRSGSGKTTLVNLLLGLLRLESGRICIDGQDISDLPYDAIRKATSLIAQDVFLFEGSIRENIRDGNPGADDAGIERAAEGANVTAFSRAMPEGLDSQVGPNGKFLSGGQRQRVSIARALIKNAPILIYDEATSSLDGESERAVMATSLDSAADRTVICIAHRLSTIRSFDRVIVLDEGRMVDSGDFDAVAARNETFRSIFHLDS